MIRNYRIVSKQNNNIAWGGGLSQRRSKIIKVTDILTRMIDTITVVLKGSFVFEDTSFSYFDTLSIKVTAASSGKITIAESIGINDLMSFSHNSSSDSFVDNMNSISDTFTLIKL